MNAVAEQPKVIEWVEAAQPLVRVLDQTRLPREEVVREVRTVEEMWQAIHELAVRGAPAIGIAAAYGVVLGTIDAASGSAYRDRDEAYAGATQAAEWLATSRPTAVNLFWALERMSAVLAKTTATDGEGLRQVLLAEARAIHAEDRDLCAAIARHGAPLLQEASSVLTHCNTGCLATGGLGTALGVILTAWQQSERQLRVYACETRPLLQGGRLTAWELVRQGVETATLLVDSAAGHAMRSGLVDAVIAGADRIAANGDVANKIGTYSLAVLAQHHKIPFYIAAPLSTFDRKLATGEAIPIEQRDAEEVRRIGETQVAPTQMPCYVPAFDVTPAELISALITERGVLRPPYRESIAAAFA